jgi:hypothetical protein
MPQIRNNPKKVETVRDLRDIYGVDDLNVNHITGSVIIKFDPQITSADQLLSDLKENGLYDSSRAITCDQKIQQIWDKATSKFCRAVFGYTVGKALEANGLSLLAALI